MLTIEECKKILNTNGKKYTDEEVDLIRSTLYKIAEVESASIIKEKIHKLGETKGVSPKAKDEPQESGKYHL
jgi:hypothetical protein